MIALGREEERSIYVRKIHRGRAVRSGNNVLHQRRARSGPIRSPQLASIDTVVGSKISHRPDDGVLRIENGRCGRRGGARYQRSAAGRPVAAPQLAREVSLPFESIEKQLAAGADKFSRLRTECAGGNVFY